MVNGIYRARALRGVLGESSSGKERVAVDFELLDEGVQGTHLTWYGYFTEKTFETTVKALRTCGWKGDDLADLSGIGSNEVSLVVENETYEGRVRPRVRWVNPPAPAAAPGMAPDKAKQFASKMRQRIAAMEASANRRAASASAARSRSDEQYDDSDLPF